MTGLVLVGAVLVPLGGVSPAGAAGPNALSFDGTGNRVDVPDAAGLRIATNLTLEARIKPAAQTRPTFAVAKNAWGIAVTPMAPGIKFQFVAGIDDVLYYADSPPLVTDKWYAVAATYDGTTMRLFVDGVLAGVRVIPGSISQSTDPLRFGTLDAVSWNPDFFDGRVDEVRLSDVVRYPAAGYSVPSTPFTTDANTRGIWHLDEGSGSTAADSSGNNHNGTLVGATWTTESPFAPSDTTPPTASVISASQVSSTTAQVSWTTNERATSRVEYGTSTAYGSTSKHDTALVTAHGVSLGGLTPSTTYHYRVISRDGSLNTFQSGDRTFTTPSATNDPAVVGQWAPASDFPIVAVHMLPLRTGEILMWDAWEIPSYPIVWNPTTNVFTELSVPFGLFCSAHVELPDGRLLIAGGHAAAGHGINTTFYFDPATKAFTRGPDMAFARWYPSASKLGDGRVVLLSGNISEFSWADTPEVYNPSTDSWSLLTSVDTSDLHEIQYPLSFTMPNGKLSTIVSSIGGTRTLDVDAQTWTAGDSTYQINGSAAQYRPGKIITSGGGFASRDPNKAGLSLTGTQVIDMNQANPNWRTTSSMASGRYLHNLVVLADGTVMGVGGADTANLEATSGPLVNELWNPDTETWSRLAPMRDKRMYHSTASVLPDGRVLAAGGGRLGIAENFATTEIYSPPYLFKGPRPTITNAPTSASYGSSITVTTPQAADIASVSLRNLASNTHALDQQQVFVPLTYTKGSGNLNVQIPANANLAPPGTYMITVVDSNGVPSVSSTVRLSGTGGDAQAPTAAVTAPSAGSDVSGSSVTLSATANDNVGVTNVQFLVDGNPVGSPDTTAPYGITWDSTTVPDGSHNVSAQARDAAGNFGTAATVPISVANAPPDTTAPVISDVQSTGISNSTATITWTTDEPSSSRVEYGTSTAYGDSTTVNPAAVTTHSVTVSGLSPDTLYHFRVESIDAAGNDRVSGDNTFTTVVGQTLFCHIENPGAGSSVSGTVPVTVTATGGTPGVANVQVKLDGVDLGAPITTAPYSLPWNTQATPDGSHTLTAVATDGGGAQTTSDPVTVTVANGPTAASALQFGGGPARVEVADAPNLRLPTNMTLEARIKPTANQNSFAVGKNAYGIQVLPGTGGIRFQFIVGVNGGLPVATSPTLPIGQWYAVAATYDGVTMRLFVDGAQVASTAVAGSIVQSSDPLRLASLDASGDFFVGVLDEVRLSGVARYPSTGYAVATGPFAADPSTKGLWHLDEGSGPTAADSSGNASNGTVIGASWTSDSPLGSVGDASSPTVGVTAPASGAVVSGNAVALSAAASDNVGVTDVRFLVDGDPVGSPDTTSPYGISWDSTTVADGAHTVSAQASDAAGNVGVAANISFTVANGPPPDTTPPVISGVAASGLSASGATVAWTTDEASNTQVEYGTSVAYGSSTTLSAALVTSHSQALGGLSPSTLYHYRVKSADAAGNLATSSDRTFTTPAAGPACPCSIWATDATPAIPDAAFGQAMELGTRFRSDMSGFVTGVRFYKGPNNTGTHTGSLWTNTGTLLATGTFSGETASGWQTLTFASPVPVAANTTYVVSYLSPTGHVSADVGYFNTGFDNAPLHGLMSGVDANGVYRQGSTGFPTSSFLNINFWVDVRFTPTPPPDTTSPSLVSRSPAPGASGVAVGVKPKVVFSEAVQPATIDFSLEDASSSAVAGAVAFDAASRTATFTPSASLAPGASYTVRVSGAEDPAGNTLTPSTWSFTTSGPTACPCSIWATDATPAIPDAAFGQAMELGTRFRSDMSGFVTGVRFYKGPNNTGTHTGSLWTNTGTLLATGTFSGETASGWQTLTFASPVPVAANTTYVVSYLSPTGHVSADVGYFNTGFDNAPLHGLMSGVDGANGVYRQGSTGFPTSSFLNINFWVDVRFTPGAG